MIVLAKEHVVCRRHHICRNCDRSICRNENAKRIVMLEYTGGRRNLVWSEYECCGRGYHR